MDGTARACISTLEEESCTRKKLENPRIIFQGKFLSYTPPVISPLSPPELGELDGAGASDEDGEGFGVSGAGAGEGAGVDLGGSGVGEGGGAGVLEDLGSSGDGEGAGAAAGVVVGSSSSSPSSSGSQSSSSSSPLSSELDVGPGAPEVEVTVTVSTPESSLSFGVLTVDVGSASAAEDIAAGEGVHSAGKSDSVCEFYTAQVRHIAHGRDRVKFSAYQVRVAALIEKRLAVLELASQRKVPRVVCLIILRKQ